MIEMLMANNSGGATTLLSKEYTSQEFYAPKGVTEFYISAIGGGQNGSNTAGGNGACVAINFIIKKTDYDLLFRLYRDRLTILRLRPDGSIISGGRHLDLGIDSTGSFGNPSGYFEVVNGDFYRGGNGGQFIDNYGGGGGSSGQSDRDGGNGAYTTTRTVAVQKKYWNQYEGNNQTQADGEFTYNEFHAGSGASSNPQNYDVGYIAKVYQFNSTTNYDYMVILTHTVNETRYEKYTPSGVRGRGRGGDSLQDGEGVVFDDNGGVVNAGVGNGYGFGSGAGRSNPDRASTVLIRW